VPIKSGRSGWVLVEQVLPWVLLAPGRALPVVT
jgi:hypothetical protein